MRLCFETTDTTTYSIHIQERHAKRPLLAEIQPDGTINTQPLSEPALLAIAARQPNHCINQPAWQPQWPSIGPKLRQPSPPEHGDSTSHTHVQCATCLFPAATTPIPANKLAWKSPWGSGRMDALPESIYIHVFLLAPNYLGGASVGKRNILFVSKSSHWTKYSHFSIWNRVQQITEL